MSANRANKKMYFSISEKVFAYNPEPVTCNIKNYPERIFDLFRSAYLV